MKDATFRDKMLDVLAYSRIPLYTNQVNKILNLFSFDGPKLEALKIMIPRVIDNQNNYALLDSFSFYSSKEKAEQIIQNYSYRGGDYGYNQWNKPPMTKQEFNRFIKAVKDKSFDDDMLRLIAVVSSSSYFTCEQCVKLMNLFSFDKEKLKVCRLIAPMLVDRQNSQIILDNLNLVDSTIKCDTFIKLVFWCLKV